MSLVRSGGLRGADRDARFAQGKRQGEPVTGEPVPHEAISRAADGWPSCIASKGVGAIQVDGCLTCLLKGAVLPIACVTSSEKPM